jgi:hypothetical protein
MGLTADMLKKRFIYNLLYVLRWGMAYPSIRIIQDTSIGGFFLKKAKLNEII